MLSFLYRFLYSIVNVVVGAFFILFGLIGILLPWSSHIRTDLVQFILENSIAVSLFGFGFIMIGALVLIDVYSNTKRKQYHVRKGKKAIVIDQEIMKSYLQTYWQKLYPHTEIPNQLAIKKNRIKITADLPYVPKTEQNALVDQIQDELQDIFSRVLGYSHELTLAISFQSPKRHK